MQDFEDFSVYKNYFYSIDLQWCPEMLLLKAPPHDSEAVIQ